MVVYRYVNIIDMGAEFPVVDHKCGGNERRSDDESDDGHRQVPFVLGRSSQSSVALQVSIEFRVAGSFFSMLGSLYKWIAVSF